MEYVGLSQLHLYFSQASVNCLQDSSCSTGLPSVSASSGSISTVLQYVFGIIGAVAVIIIIVAAIKFITSMGDPQSVNRARQTIIYAAIGLLVAVTAELIVTYVLYNV